MYLHSLYAVRNDYSHVLDLKPSTIVHPYPFILH